MEKFLSVCRMLKYPGKVLGIAAIAIVIAITSFMAGSYVTNLEATIDIGVATSKVKGECLEAYGKLEGKCVQVLEQFQEKLKECREGRKM